jgi:general secretion pathway protein N
MRRARYIAATAALLAGALAAHGANSPNPLDLPPSNVLPAPVEIAPGAPASPQQPAELPPTEPNGNPLWAIPLSSLTATRERPLFLPSRRAPAAAVAGPIAVAPPPPPPPPAQPERPALMLIGVIVGESDGFAVFLDQATNAVVRLKTGQDHDGWVLRAVKGREATLHKNGKSEILALPVPGGVGGIAGGEAHSDPAPPPGAVPDYLRPGGGRGLPAAVPLPGGGLGVPRRPEPEL